MTSVASIPMFDAVAIRQAREASMTGASAAAANGRARSNSATSPRPQPYPLIRNPSSPYPTYPSIQATATASPLAQSSSIPATAPSAALPASAGKEESLIDPELLALDALPALPIPSSDLAAQVPTAGEDQAIPQLDFTQPLDLPFQAPLFDVPPLDASPSSSVVDLAPAPAAGADLLGRLPLSLQTALDSHRFSDHSGAPSSITSYPSVSLPGSQEASQDSSPVTPFSDDGASAYEPGPASSGGAGARDEGGVPAPKVKPKKSHARKQPEGHVKRARNAFILFRKHITDSNLIPTSVEVKHQNISVVAAKMWREAPQDVRAKFQEMARIEKEEHQRKYPNYRYQPVFRRTDIIRRRVRKDGAEDEKVEAVAEALIKGKAGGELEKEIKEQALVGDPVDISPEGSAARSRSRRRRDPGQLSKGAIRAQKAQARQKAMRQNLLGHNLLNMSLYNAQQQQQQQQRAMAMAQHQQAGAHHYVGGYDDPHGQMDYMPAPMGYDADPRTMVDVYGNPVPGGTYDSYGAAYANEYPDDMYALPLMGYEDPQQAAYDVRGMEAYYAGGQEMDPHSPYGAPRGHLEGYMPGYDMPEVDAYRLPPLLSPAVAVHGDGYGMSMPTSAIPGGGLHARVEDEDERREWGMGGVAQQQQEPSGHVMFNEGLFEGELGMEMGIGSKGLDDGLGDFDQAVQQANDMW